eukprot:354625-Chlamydomonas_euryale.AAC.13
MRHIDAAAADVERRLQPRPAAAGAGERAAGAACHATRAGAAAKLAGYCRRQRDAVRRQRRASQRATRLGVVAWLRLVLCAARPPGRQTGGWGAGAQGAAFRGFNRTVAGAARKKPTFGSNVCGDIEQAGVHVRG